MRTGKQVELAQRRDGYIEKGESERDSD